MNTRAVGRFALLATVALSFTLTGCAGMSRQQQNAAIGAVAGGVAGSILSSSPIAVVGGAAIGAVIGHGSR